ncbi:hypothetical protein GCM10027446_00350 [Angustibacter peucedani]
MMHLELRVSDRFDEVAETAAGWLAQAGPDADPVQVRRMQLVRAVADARRGRLEDGAATMRGIRDWAHEQGEWYLQARAERQLGVLLRRAGEASGSLEHAVASVSLLAADAPVAIRADHQIGLADALSVSGSSAEAVAAYRAAVELGRRSGQVDLHLLALNNFAYTLYEIGSDQESVALCEQMLALLAEHDLELPLHVLDTVANAYLAVGRPDDAEQLFVRVDLAEAAPEDAAESWLTLARLRRDRGDLAGAQESLDRCVGTCADHDLGDVEVRAMGEQAELFAARGDFRAAFELYKQFHDRQLTQHAVEREARARMMQAIFETERARRESARFRELSYRDALTQLHNRRYVDDHLTSLLDALGQRGGPSSVAVAFVDLDHFKLVNDTCSHEVGDEVLRRVARLLAERAEEVPDGFAARMGGEEFLLVLPGIDAGAAPALLERVRVDVEALDWAGLTAGLPVTASLGGATAPQDGTERLVLLACADQRLYVAKRAGRNRVVTAAGVVGESPDDEVRSAAEVG